MPKATSNSSKTSKPPTQAARKRKSTPIDHSERDTSPPPTMLDKAFVLRLIIARLESAKTFDWYNLAQKMGPKIIDTGAKGKKKGKEEGGWTGTELHDMYHNVILPSLKSGRALWLDDECGADFLLSTAFVSDKSTPEKTVTADEADIEQVGPGLEEGQLLDELETPKSTKKTKKNVKANNPGKDAADATSYRQLVMGKGEAGKKRMRPAYDDVDANSLDEASDKTIADATTTVPAVKKRGARSAKMVTQYVDVPEYESEEGEGVEACLA